MLVVVLIGHGKSDRVTSLQVAETYHITTFLSATILDTRALRKA